MNLPGLLVNDFLSSYHDREQVARETRAGRHREVIGGLWEEIGRLQFERLVRDGLEPSMVFLDVGCGCLRAGVHFVRYLDSGNYYGIDLNESLLQAGWERELDRGLRIKLPRANLLSSGNFDVASFGRKFEMAIAHSVFTHLPLNHIRLCLERLAPSFDRGGRLYATFFECPRDRPVWQPLAQQPSGIRTSATANPYHYRVRDLLFAAEGLPWEFEYIGEWDHPHGQRLVLFHRP